MYNRLHYAWVVLGVGTLVVFGALGLARFGYTMLLPPMQEALHWDNTYAGALATANLCGYLALAVVGGALASHFGPRKVIVCGLTVAGLGMVMTGLAAGFPSAAGYRFLTGVGSGASNVPVMALLSAWFAPRYRGLASGIGVTGSSLALIALGPSVPYLVSRGGGEGWRTCWFVLGGVTVVLAVLAQSFLRDRPSEMGILAFGASESEEASVSSNGGLHWGRVYRSWHLWHLGAVYVAFGFAYMIYMTFFTKALITDGGYTKQAAGNLFMTMGWASLVCGLLWGAVSDRIGRKRALVIVYLLHTAAFSLFGLVPTPVGFTVSAILFGISAWSIPAIMAAACGDLLGARLAPAGLGFITLFFGVGQAFGPYVGGLIADANHSMLPAQVVAGAVSLAGAVGATLLPRTRTA